jgi:two-component system, NarL family, sensor histidine kinase UhpB
MSPAGTPGRPVPPLDALHRAAVAGARDGVIAIGAGQRIVMINPAAQRMFGCHADEVLGKPLSRLIPPAQRRAHARQVRAFDASGTTERAMGTRGVVTGLRADGTTFPAAVTILRVADGRHFMALVCDLSREEGLRLQLDALNLRMRTVFELAPVAIWITDADRIVFANHRCAELFGAADRDMLIGRSIYGLMARESRTKVAASLAQALADTGAPPMLGERIIRLDGKPREVVITIAALPDHGKTVVQMVITDITERAQERRELERSRGELRRLSANLVQAREDERRRIARELHDELGQRLTALKMELASLGAQADGAARIAAMLDMVDETVASVRRIATDLRPLMLDDLGLNAAIEWLAQSWAERMGIQVRLRLGAADADIGDAAAIALYRVVQEALTNIARHAGASLVRIGLAKRGGLLRLTVQDNGSGLSAASAYREGSHGLMGIRERAFMLGGELQIGNARGGGGRITVCVPLRAGPADKTRPRGTSR